MCRPPPATRLCCESPTRIVGFVWRDLRHSNIQLAVELDPRVARPIPSQRFRGCPVPSFAWAGIFVGRSRAVGEEFLHIVLATDLFHLLRPHHVLHGQFQAAEFRMVVHAERVGDVEAVSGE